MRTILLSIALFLTLSQLNAQSMANFFKYEGVKHLAYLAHPFSSYESGSFAVYQTSVEVTIRYTEGVTKLTLKRSGDYFTDIRVNYDDFWISPFGMTELIKDFAVEFIMEDVEDNGVLNSFEKFLGKTIYDMTGVNLACVYMTGLWFNY